MLPLHNSPYASIRRLSCIVILHYLLFCALHYALHYCSLHYALHYCATHFALQVHYVLHCYALHYCATHCVRDYAEFNLDHPPLFTPTTTFNLQICKRDHFQPGKRKCGKVTKVAVRFNFLSHQRRLIKYR